jgi:hypothetical protein
MEIPGQISTEINSRGVGSSIAQGQGGLRPPFFVVTEHLARDPNLMFVRAFSPAGARRLSPRAGGIPRGAMTDTVPAKSEKLTALRDRR